jgi:myo-inositol-1(or 4)-monophosphatase
MSTHADDLEFAKSLAAEAAALARDRQSRIAAQEKANRSFVTDLDLDLERMIRQRIAARYPDDSLTGEELAAAGGGGPRRWCIDPIDGTGNLVHGFPLWSISIGLIDGGEPVLGVIAVPPLNETYWATKGGGAWCNGRRLAASDADEFHDHDNVCASTNALRALDPRTIPGRIRDIGSACCELAFVTSGRVRACLFLGEQTHDLAAGAVMAAEAGCWFARLDGEMLTLGGFVTNTPVRVPTIIAPPRRLERLLLGLRPLPPLPEPIP